MYLGSSCVIMFDRFEYIEAETNGHDLSDDIFKCIFLKEYIYIWISRKVSLKCVPNVQIKMIPALVQIMAWYQPGGVP